MLAAVVGSQAWAQERQRSNYTPFRGEPFFLLSDATYGSADTALVRLETPGPSSLSEYGGADIVVYRVPEPLAFLKKQRNLHRVDVAANYRGEGLANTLRFLWDSWWKQSRQAWRRLFKPEARVAVTQQHPGLATSSAIHRPTVFAHHPQYQPLTGFELVDSFRYPLWQAKAIAPPKGVKLDGSSSEFISTREGNVMIPIGKRKPGLYLIEAIIGEHRATTLVFVSDTMAVTKVSSNQMLVWTARRDNGAAVAGASLAWTDGTGVLASSVTGSDGVALLERGSPEHTYVIGEDRGGGVFVSENFYYDSEIYNTKLYAVTDRPLYRPGDEVHVKFLGREFLSARTSRAAGARPINLTVVDPNGTPLLTRTVQLSGEEGANTRFLLPREAGAGGYELRFTYNGDLYGAAFRVAEYLKPHFAIDIQPGKPDFKTGEAVKATVALRYPDGKPVANARLSVSLRSQKNTMVDGELRYSGQFPVALKTEELTADRSGEVTLTLPAASEPSRYILTVLATDGAAYRVKTTREIMIERAAATWQLKAARQFSDPGQTVRFTLTPEAPGAVRPVQWEMVQLESQRKTEGKFDPAAASWDVRFPDSGSYQLALRDGRGNLVAAASHWVSGAGLKVTPGSIEIVLDRVRYRPGETAEALISFSEDVDQALLTLERDKVEQHGLMAGGAGWYKAVRVTPRQWRVRIPVTAEHGPNITFSVAYTRHGEFVFENAGLQVVEPRIALQFTTDKPVYQPGETVTLDVLATLDGKPVSTLVALGVVDEMIYVLQPEIAPDIGEFFYHPRRNNVRTTASLSFISYDLAQGRTSEAPARHNYNERAVKVLERPRRDNVDTALWAPSLRTDAAGRVRVTFRMPDALTRWRITGRAMDAQGRVGQRTGYLRSDKRFYAKWTSPDWMRVGDAPRASVAVFNQAGTAQALALKLSGAGPDQVHKLDARPGVNYVSFPLAAKTANLRLELLHEGRAVDVLDTPVQALPLAWSSPRSLAVPLQGAATAFTLPPDARNIRVSFAHGAASHFTRIADDLIDYPYGCVEQTASRLIPLSLALQGAGPEGLPRERLLATLTAQRLRLVSMAGPEAVFGWWGNATSGDALMTAYAYYADWYAARTLGIELPAEHWNRLLETYSRLAQKHTITERALALWMAREMGLPTRTLVSGLVDDAALTAPVSKPRGGGEASSLLLGADDRVAQAVGVGLVALLARADGVELPPALAQQVDAAWPALRALRLPAARALLLLSGDAQAGDPESILSSVSSEMPTLDRAMTLVWVQKKLGGPQFGKGPDPLLQDGWQKLESATGRPVWRWTGAGVPAQLATAGAIPPGTVAVVRFDSRAPEAHALPVTVQRRLLRLEPGKQGYTLEPVPAGQALDTTALYLDEITLAPAGGFPNRFGLLEVALPPGAAVEGTTWGINIVDKKTEALERARHVERRDGYAVPIDVLNKPLTVRHLVRFSQKGSFVLPPARYHRMYQPELKAFESTPVRTLRVQ